MKYFTKQFTKGFIFSVLGLLTVATSHSYAWPTIPNAEQMKANYDLCEKSDESWHRRWGQYVVAFDMNEASKVCREQPSYGYPASAELVSCRHDHSWIYAGYYCQEFAGGVL